MNADFIIYVVSVSMLCMYLGVQFWAKVNRILDNYHARGDRRAINKHQPTGIKQSY